MMGTGAMVLWWGLVAACAQDQFLGPAMLRASSGSGQFLVQAVSPEEPARILATNQSLIHLEPTLLTVSAERIKQELWRALDANQAWQGKVFVTLYPATSADDGAVISSERFNDGWHYRVLLPNVVQRTRYVRAMTEVLLLEMANRSAGPRSAEIPTWLVEGLARQLLASKEAEIILPPPATPGASSARLIQTPAGPVLSGLALTSVLADGRWEDPLNLAYKELTSYPPLSFQDLSWPTDGQLADEAGELYRSSAQLFVNNLLRLEDGRACLRAFLAELPRHYNWQFAFLLAFQGHFQRPLDIEKWWALQVAAFTGHDLAQTWPQAKSWEELDQTLRFGIQVRTRADELPLHAEASLQNIVRDWDRVPQTLALQTKLRELELVRSHVSHDLFFLVGDYRQVIANYLANRDQSGFPLGLRKNAAQRRAAAVALMQLNALDAQRLALRPVPSPASASTQTQPPHF